MSYGYSVVYDEGLEGMLLLNGISTGLSGIIHLAIFVFTALALYTLAKRRGIRKPWLAWIPVANAWILGSLSDQYRYVVRGEYKSKRKILIALSIVQAVVYAVFVVLAVVVVGHVFFGTMHRISEYELMDRILGPVFGLLGLCIPVIGVAIAYTVIYYMALYDVYTSCDPRNNVMYLVLSIIFGVTKPFFLFFNRNKDDGMPPRREQEPVFMQEQPPVWEQMETE